MNILKYARDQMQHRRTHRRKEKKTHTSDKRNLENSYYEYQANTRKKKLQYVQYLFKMDLRRNIFSTTNQEERNKTIKKPT